MKKSLAITIFSILAFIGGVLFFRYRSLEKASSHSAPLSTGSESIPPVITLTPPVSYTLATLTTDTPFKELEALVGKDNVATVLKLNRIDAQFLTKGGTLIIPSTYDWNALSPFPDTLAIANNIPKLLLFSQRVQAFGVYEYGHLVRWGPISSGKQSTPTPNRLYFTTWKSEWIRSTENYDWILKWNFNLDNFSGVGMHEYELPGYPASHACIRMVAEDARWLYAWADQWKVSQDEQMVVARGTPVIVFGEYDYNAAAPWKKLPESPTATTISIEELGSVVQPNIVRIEE